jgi:hypothetical protein
VARRPLRSIAGHAGRYVQDQDHGLVRLGVLLVQDRIQLAPKRASWRNGLMIPGGQLTRLPKRRHALFRTPAVVDRAPVLASYAETRLRPVCQRSWPRGRPARMAIGLSQLSYRQLDDFAPGPRRRRAEARAHASINCRRFANRSPLRVDPTHLRNRSSCSSAPVLRLPCSDSAVRFREDGERHQIMRSGDPNGIRTRVTTLKGM